MTFPKSFQVGGSLPIPLKISNKTAAYTVVAGDLGTIINFTNTATATVSLTAAAVLGSGFNVQIISNGTGTLIIDPNGSETIDSNTTWRITKGQGLNILCNGTNFFTTAIRTSGQSADTVALGNGSDGSPSIASTSAGATALNGSFASGESSLAACSNLNGFGFGALGGNSIALGHSATASGNSSAVVGGTGNTASALRCVALGGIDNVASASYSYAFGFRGLAAYIGKYAYGGAGGSGQFQGGYMVLSISTTDATATKLSSNGSAAGADNQVILANNQAMVVTGSILCRQSVAGSDKASGWTFTAVIRRGANAASTTLVAAVTPVLVAQDVSLAATAVSVTADTTNGGLSITVTGIAATNLRWLATVDSAEVVYA